MLDVREINIDSSNMLNHDLKNIEINFIQEDILNSLKYYKYTPFYNYLNYTKSMKKLNYLSNDIILYFLSEIFKPLLLISIAFVVTGYVSKFQRNESFFKTIFIAIIIGFIIFLIDKLIYSINANNLISYLIIVSTIPILSVSIRYNLYHQSGKKLMYFHIILINIISLFLYIHISHSADSIIYADKIETDKYQNIIAKGNVKVINVDEILTTNELYIDEQNIKYI